MAMSGEDTTAVARAGAVFTKEVTSKTMVYLLRLRSRLTIKRTQSEVQTSNELLAEEAIAIAVDGQGNQQLLSKAEIVTLMHAQVSKNMTPEARTRELSQAIDHLDVLSTEFELIAKERAEAVLADHRRSREAADARGSYSVQPQLPVDVMGVYVLVPDAGLL